MENVTQNPRRRPRKKTFWERLFTKKNKETKAQPAAEQPAPKTRRKQEKRSPIYAILIPLFFVLSFAFMEFVFHARVFKNGSVLFPVLFAIPTGIAVGIFCDLFKEKIARILRYVIAIGSGVWGQRRPGLC